MCDLVEAKRALRTILAALPTFRKAAERVYDERQTDWDNAKHRKQWLKTLETYAFPSIGNRPIDTVTAGDVRAVLLPIWQTKAETARRVLQRIGTVLDWAFSQGHCAAEAPIRSIRVGLSRQTQQPKHFTSLPHNDVANLMAKLRQSDTVGRLALRFTILTAARSGEARGATWEEIDIGEKVWTVPAARMKARKAHRVPLSAAALKILDTAAKPRNGKPREPIFSGTGDRPLSDATMTKTLRYV